MKPSTSTHAIARRGTSALGVPDPLSHGGRGLLATPAGAVACELEPVGLDANGARYELRVTNGTPGVLASTVSAIRVDEGRPVAALAIEIEPHAAIRTGFSLDAALAYERVVAEVHGEGVHLVVEAPPPRGGRPRRRWVGPATAIGVAALLAGGTLVFFGIERPHVVDAALLANPDGKLIARWSTAGSGKRTYELRDARGAVLAQGPLPEASGEMPVGRADAASLRIAIANGFGSDARDAAYARATPPPAVRIVATPPPRIASLAIEPPRPNAPLTVRYAADARDLELSIVDRTGATYFSTKTPSGSGTIQVPAPPAGPREPYQLVARAEGAGAGASQETRVPIAAAVSTTPPPSPLAQGSAGPSSRPRPGSNATVVDAGGGDTFAIRPDPVRPGEPFVVDIPFSDSARVQVVRTRDDVELAGADLHHGERSVALTAPSSPGDYTVRVTMQRGVGLETLVRPLRIAGH
ncbi:MAG: hypothetical protein JO036_16590 [Candidatus Eremiobacteraeota bacterium]|nr:hypothetical protein [Candidatus Eremiobacteraeota bacterium]